MKFNIFYPSSKLQNIVKQYLVIYSIEDARRLLFLPNGSNFIVFNREIEIYSKTYTEDKKFYIPKNYSISVKGHL
ncbi:MAG: hypothetical protein U9P72_08850 [Campylobacterota bacterium]|nr:hypothetical protein [Campylobacterota bacterium]